MSDLIVVLIFLLVIIVILGYKLITLHHKLKTSVSQEDFDAAKNLESKKAELKFQELYKELRETELIDIRLQEKTTAGREAKVELEKWKMEQEKKIRADAINRSQAVTIGKVTEHLVPYFDDFSYNPKDCRFLGAPVDLIIFDGLSEDKLDKVVFMEIKTADSGLSRREKQIRDIIKAGKVEWEEKRVKSQLTNS